MTKFKFPSAYTILFVLIALVAALSWIVPAGKYEMTMNEALGKEVPVAGTYKLVEGNPQGSSTCCWHLSMASTTTTPMRQAPSTSPSLS